MAQEDQKMAGGRIGLLTSGGDCAGLNAAIRAVVLRAERYGMEVIGIRRGTDGLMCDPPDVLTLGRSHVSGGLLRQGGTILGTTNKNDPFDYPDGRGGRADRSADAIAGLERLDLKGLIVVGGDGSLAILRRLAQQGGFGLVGIPKTIDNDVDQTELSIGFPSAVEVATSALDHLQPTAASHDRVMVLEVMGRDAGHIALNAGIAGGADVILIPEIPWSMEAVAAHISDLRKAGRNFALVVVAEAVKTPEGMAVMQTPGGGGKSVYGGIGHAVGAGLAEATGAEVRVTVLGHVQRGGTPDPRDRIIASAFAVHAVDLVAEGRFDRMVAWANREVVDVPLESVVGRSQCVDPAGALVETARGLGICLGS